MSRKERAVKRDFDYRIYSLTGQKVEKVRNEGGNELVDKMDEAIRERKLQETKHLPFMLLLT